MLNYTLVVPWILSPMHCSMAANFGQLLLSRIGVGIGEAGGTPAASSIMYGRWGHGRRVPRTGDRTRDDDLARGQP